MSATNGRDLARVARGCEPIVNGGADSTALDRRIAWPVMAGDEHDHALAGCDRLLETPVDRPPSAI